MRAAPAADYSDEQLRAAWAACRRPTWPASFEEAMTQPLCAAQVRLQAWHWARVPPQPAIAAPAPVRRLRATVLPPGFVDHKRAAAGDRDDD
jgi:hypothetical protein